LLGELAFKLGGDEFLERQLHSAILRDKCGSRQLIDIDTLQIG
jgi:hypothetical protein